MTPDLCLIATAQDLADSLGVGAEGHHLAMSNSSNTTDSATRAQKDADTMGMNEDDEAAAKQQWDERGEPHRDALGNEDGAS